MPGFDPIILTLSTLFRSLVGDPGWRPRPPWLPSSRCKKGRFLDPGVEAGVQAWAWCWAGKPLLGPTSLRSSPDTARV